MKGKVERPLGLECSQVRGNETYHSEYEGIFAGDLKASSYRRSRELAGVSLTFFRGERWPYLSRRELVSSG